MEQKLIKKFKKLKEAAVPKMTQVRKKNKLFLGKK